MQNRIVNQGAKVLVGLALTFLGVTAVHAQGGAEANYKAKCAGCHGADGAGSTPAGKAMGVHDFKSADVQKETDPQLTDIITNGKGKMPKYADKLKDTEIKDLVVYIRKLSKG